MNEPTHYEENPAPLEPSADDDCGIAIALLGFTGGTLGTAKHVLDGALRALFRRDGIEYKGLLCGCLPTHTLALVTVPQSQRAEMLRAVHSALKELALLPLCHIGYMDVDEGFWRTVYPPQGTNFGGFVKSADLDKAAQTGRLMLKELIACLTAKQSSNPQPAASPS